MSEKMEFWWVVAFALRRDAIDWWISSKESNPNTYWLNFSKVILTKFQPEVWQNKGNDKIQDENQEPITSQFDEIIYGEVEGTQIKKYFEKEDCAVDVKFDSEGA